MIIKQVYDGTHMFRSRVTSYIWSFQFYPYHISDTAPVVIHAPVGIWSFLIWVDGGVGAGRFKLDGSDNLENILSNYI